MAGIPKFIKPMRVGAGGIIKFIIKNYYWFILILVLLPVLITSFETSFETANPTYSLIQLGLHITNADTIIYDDVQLLEEDPALLIGMEKPTKGIWKSLVYFWHIFLVIWKEFGLVWLISFPFVILYKAFRLQGSKGFQSSVQADATKSMIWGVIFIFVINLILVISKLIAGSIEYSFPENTGIYQQTFLIILTTLPFHGVVSLGMYLITLL